MPLGARTLNMQQRQKALAAGDYKAVFRTITPQKLIADCRLIERSEQATPREIAAAKAVRQTLRNSIATNLLQPAHVLGELYEDASREIEQLNADLQAKTAELQQLTKELGERPTDKAFVALETAIVELRTEVSEKAQSIEQLNLDLDELNAALEAEEEASVEAEEIAELALATGKQQIEAITGEKITAQRELSILQATLPQLKISAAESESLKRQLAELKKSLTEKESEAAQALAEAERLQNAAELAREEETRLTGILEQKDTRITKLTQELEAAAARTRKLARAKSTLTTEGKKETARLSAELQTETEQRQAVAAELAQTKQALEEAWAQQAEAEAIASDALKTGRAEAAKLQQELKSLNVNLLAAKTKLGTTQQNLAAANKKVAELEAQLEETEEKLAAAEQEAATAKQELAEARSTNKEAELTISELVLNQTELSGKLREAQEEAAAARQEAIDARQEAIDAREGAEETITALNESVEQETALLRETIGSLEETLGKRNDTIAGLRGEIAGARDENEFEGLTARVAELEEEIRNSVIQLQKAQQKTEEWRTKSAEKTRAANRAERRLERAQEQHTAATVLAGQRLEAIQEAARQEQEAIDKRWQTYLAEQLANAAPPTQDAQGWYQEATTLQNLFGIIAPIVLNGQDTADSTVPGNGFIIKTNAGKRQTKKLKAKGLTGNEDSAGYAKLPDGREVFVVADGMGGHKGGAIASQLVVQFFLRAVVSGADPADAIKLANRQMVEELQSGKYDDVLKQDAGKVASSGSTLVATILDRKNRNLKVYHAGDSPAHFIQDGESYLLTKSHDVETMMAEQGYQISDQVQVPGLGKLDMPLPVSKLAEIEAKAQEIKDAYARVNPSPDNQARFNQIMAQVTSGLGTLNLDDQKKTLRNPSHISELEIDLVDSTKPSIL